jgi:N6-L-threonylcarbamoyladenine synthase
MSRRRGAGLLGLGIESTAHTFGASVMGSDGRVLADRRDVYKAPPGSGIHPREASRHHAEVAPSVLKDCFDQANVRASELDFIAYSGGPGLGPCLRVGAVVARSLSSFYHKPLVPVNHAVGHLELGSLLCSMSSPVCLLVSGGHTAVVVPAGRRWRIFGETLDITIGQLLDQFGRHIGLGSPCGPAIEKLALKGKSLVELPYVVKGNDVSFSGLLTAAKNQARNHSHEDLAHSIQEHAYAMLCEVAERALAFSERKELLVVGGVSANRRLMEMISAVARRQETRSGGCPPAFSGDCGAQIAWAGLKHFQAGLSVRPVDGFVRQSWRLDTVDVPWRS